MGRSKQEHGFTDCSYGALPVFTLGEQLRAGHSAYIDDMPASGYPNLLKRTDSLFYITNRAFYQQRSCKSCHTHHSSPARDQLVFLHLVGNYCICRHLRFNNAATFMADQIINRSNLLFGYARHKVSCKLANNAPAAFGTHTNGKRMCCKAQGQDFSNVYIISI